MMVAPSRLTYKKPFRAMLPYRNVSSDMKPISINTPSEIFDPRNGGPSQYCIYTGACPLWDIFRSHEARLAYAPAAWWHISQGSRGPALGLSAQFVGAFLNPRKSRCFTHQGKNHPILNIHQNPIRAYQKYSRPIRSAYAQSSVTAVVTGIIVPRFSVCFFL